MSSRSEPPGAVPSFTPVPVRSRSDGWTPERQIALVQALAETCTLEEAAQQVGMTARSARKLRMRRDAGSLRVAWDAAIAAGIGRLTEAAMARAIHGVPVPIFYKGEQVGERRVFNERVTAFLLRHHAPQQYGAWRDQTIFERADPDGATVLLARAIQRLAVDCVADATGNPRPRLPPLRLEVPAAEAEAEADRRREAAEQEQADRREREESAAFEARLIAERVAQERADRRARDAGSSASGGTSASPQEGDGASAPDLGGTYGTSDP